MTPAESHYLATLRSLYPMATESHLLDSPQFLAYRETLRGRAWQRRKPVTDGTLAKVFPAPVAPVCELMRVRLCAKCGLNFFATVSPFCGECLFLPRGERPSQPASVCNRAEGMF